MKSLTTDQESHLPELGNEDAEHQQFLTFVSAGETFGISILAIKEILEFGDLTHVPMMPEYVRGVMNLRGSVVPVIDLSARLGREISTEGKRTCIVIVEVQYEDEVLDIGVVVDGVNEVIEIPAENIEPSPAFGASIRTDFISGMARIDEKFVVLLDVNHVLSIEELSILDQAGKVSAPVQTETQA